MQPPVTLEEFRDFLNLDVSDVTDDEERWNKLVAATGLVEAKVGAMRVRTVVEFVRSESAAIVTREWPVVSITSVVPVDIATSPPVNGSGLVAVGGYVDSTPLYEVTYVVGRETIPPELAEATLIVAEQLWSASQRGPAVARPGTQGANDPVMRGFAWPSRAKELIADHRMFSVA